MGTLSMFILLIIIGIILIISLYYATNASVKVGKFGGYQNDENLAQAYKYLTWTVTVIWIVIALLIISVIFLFIYGSQIIVEFGSWIITILLLIVFSMTIAVGVMSVLAAIAINASTETANNPDLESAYTDAVIASVATLLTIGLLFFGYIFYHAAAAKANQQKEVDEANAAKAAEEDNKKITESKKKKVRKQRKKNIKSKNASALQRAKITAE